jgi:hypothetical protein
VLLLLIIKEILGEDYKLCMFSLCNALLIQKVQELSAVELGSSSILRVELKVEDTPTNDSLPRAAFLSFHRAR